MKRPFEVCPVIVLSLFVQGLIVPPASAQTSVESVFNGHRIIIPASSIPQAGRHHTNYFFVDSDKPSSKPPSGVETCLLYTSRCV